MHPETEAIDKLFLELSQFTMAKTKREMELEAKVKDLQREVSSLEALVRSLEDSV